MYNHEMSTMAKNMAKHFFSSVSGMCLIIFWGYFFLGSWKHFQTYLKKEGAVVTIISTKNIYGTCLFSEVLLETKPFRRLGFQLPMLLLLLLLLMQKHCKKKSIWEGSLLGAKANDIGTKTHKNTTLPIPFTSAATQLQMPKK